MRHRQESDHIGLGESEELGSYFKFGGKAIEGFSDIVCGLLSGEEIAVGGQEWQRVSSSEAVVRVEIGGLD